MNDVHNVSSVVTACVSLSNNADTNNELRSFIRTSLPKTHKSNQLWWLRHHVRKRFNEAIVKNYMKLKPMAKSYLDTKWSDLLCDIYVENAALKVVKRKKAANKLRYACLIYIFFLHLRITTITVYSKFTGTLKQLLINSYN